MQNENLFTEKEMNEALDFVNSLGLKPVTEMYWHGSEKGIGGAFCGYGRDNAHSPEYYQACEILQEVLETKFPRKKDRISIRVGEDICFPDTGEIILTLNFPWAEFSKGLPAEGQPAGHEVLRGPAYFVVPIDADLEKYLSLFMEIVGEIHDKKSYRGGSYFYYTVEGQTITRYAIFEDDKEEEQQSPLVESHQLSDWTFFNNYKKWAKAIADYQKLRPKYLEKYPERVKKLENWNPC